METPSITIGPCRPTPASVLDAVCALYGADRTLITRPRRKRNGGLHVEKARQVACYLLRAMGYRVQEVGRLMGYATHCQATKNIRLTINIASVDHAFGAEINTLAQQLSIDTQNIKTNSKRK